MERVILLLGGNIGDVEHRIERAVELIKERIGQIALRSTMLRSEPWGFNNEAVAPFTNLAIEVETELDPEKLLDATQQIERETGRERNIERDEKERLNERYASRKIDIDIIFYGERVHNSERLTIPHPLLCEREFVLEPIVQIRADLRHPIVNKSCFELLEELKNR